MDPSSSIFSEFAAEEQAIQVETITYLKHKWYKAALDGNAEAFNFYQGPLHCLVTPNQNTVLHVYLGIQNCRIRTIGIVPFFYFCTRVQASNLRSTKFVQQILNKCPLLLWKANAKGEIPLHIAARFGHSNIVELLIKTAEAEQKNLENGIEPGKQMLRMRDNEGNTALHRAVQYGHDNVVRELLLADHDFSYFVNHRGETPLYIAARRGYNRLVTMILDITDSADHEGPCGRTALHAAVMAADKWTTEVLLNKRKKLVKATDENGQTPLHYAAHLGYTSIVKLLLECDESAAYQIDKEKMTALHMAARQGHPLVMREIINYCPDCCEIVDKRGWNFYHFAAVSLPLTTLAIFLKVDSCRRFVDEEDIHGNTPLQLLAASRQYEPTMAEAFKDDLESVRTENLDSKKKEQILGLLDEVGGGEVAGVAVNPLRQFQCKEDQEKFDKVREARAVVAALIATVAFAAAFTLPGGYKSDQSDEDRGSAILSHNSAFKAFVIADAIAMISALLAIKFNSLTARPVAAVRGIQQYGEFTYQLMVKFGLLAEAALTVAFIVGLYAVLEPSLALAITTCIIILCFFLGYILLSAMIMIREF